MKPIPVLVSMRCDGRGERECAARRRDAAMLVITHYQRLLDYIKPDMVHVLARGRIAASGGPELALELEREGYDKYLRAA